MDILTKKKMYRINTQIAREIIESFLGIPTSRDNIQRLANFMTALELEPQNIHPLTQAALDRAKTKV